MIFVAVRHFSDTVAAQADVQSAANSIWKGLIEGEAEAGNVGTGSMLRWLSEKTRGNFRAWVEIVRREPTLDARQRISGSAGYRFSNLEDASRFAEAFGMPDLA